MMQKHDSSYLEYDRTYRIDMLKEVVVIDTLGTVGVRDSLFGSSEDYKNMAYVPVGAEDKPLKSRQTLSRKTVIEYLCSK